MSEQKRVQLLFLGIPKIKTKYRGDGLFCDTEQKKTCNITVDDLKAYQLLKDFPEEWELVNYDGTVKDFLKNVPEAEERTLARSTANRSVRVIDETGKEFLFPAGTKFVLSVSKGKPVVKETIKKITDKIMRKTSDELPAKLDYGKYKGKTVEEIAKEDVTYLGYLASGNHNEKPEITNIAKAILENLSKTDKKE